MLIFLAGWFVATGLCGMLLALAGKQDVDSRIDCFLFGFTVTCAGMGIGVA